MVHFHTCEGFGGAETCRKTLVVTETGGTAGQRVGGQSKPGSGPRTLGAQGRKGAAPEYRRPGRGSPTEEAVRAHHALSDQVVSM